MTAYARAVNLVRTLSWVLLGLLVAVPLAVALGQGPEATLGAEADSSDAPASEAEAVPSPTAVPSPSSAVPFVPVRRFWSTQRDISLEVVRAAIEGRSDDYRRVVIASDAPSALWAALDVVPAATTRAVSSPRKVKRALDRSGQTLGLLPAERDGDGAVVIERMRRASKVFDEGGAPAGRPSRRWRRTGGCVRWIRAVAAGDGLLDPPLWRRSAGGVGAPTR